MEKPLIPKPLKYHSNYSQGLKITICNGFWGLTLKFMSEIASRITIVTNLLQKVPVFAQISQYNFFPGNFGRKWLIILDTYVS